MRKTTFLTSIAIFVALLASSGTLFAQNVTNFKCLQTLFGHYGDVISVAVSPTESIWQAVQMTIPLLYGMLRAVKVSKSWKDITLASIPFVGVLTESIWQAVHITIPLLYGIQRAEKNSKPWKVIPKASNP